MPFRGKSVVSLIIYDAAAGGAGHVRRLVTDDGKVLNTVIEKAIAICEGCDCDGSCYKCLRNYYNQKIHDQLDRHIAANFIKPWLGVMKPIEEQQQEEQPQQQEEKYKLPEWLFLPWHRQLH